MQLIPGSNPAFGLNTLGGALAIYTKSGADYPGGGLEVLGGSFGRRSAQAQWGGSRGPLDYFFTGEFFDDNGWAQHNPSRVQQFFGKVGWQDEETDLDVSFTAADNHLQGTQTLPLSFLSDIRQAYTFPDLNTNRLAFLTLKGSHFLELGPAAGRQRLLPPVPQPERHEQRERRLRHDSIRTAVRSISYRPPTIARPSISRATAVDCSSSGAAHPPAMPIS